MKLDDARRELHALCATLEALRPFVREGAEWAAFKDAWDLTMSRARYYAREYASALQREPTPQGE